MSSNTTGNLIGHMQAFEKENTAFEEKGNRAAGTRARKHLMEIAKLAKQRRAEISAKKNSKE